MLTGTSTESAAAFIASYHRPPATVLRWTRRRQAAKQRPFGMHTRERWAWFRIGVLDACRRWPAAAVTLRARFGIGRRVPGSRRITSPCRVMWRNLALLVRGGFLLRTDDGYRTTARGMRVLGDLKLLDMDTPERAP